MHPSRIDLGLERVATVWQRLLSEGLSLSSPIIVVGGTNGKGSTIAFLEAIYQQAGYRTVVYTSPHLDEFNERIRIACENASDSQLIEAFTQVERARGEISLSYFEFATLAALLIACAESPDILILEVGLGGRLDAVNILQHDVAIVTNIAMDHMQWLGHDLAEIAVEKAAIARPGRPLIIADYDAPESLAVQVSRIGAKEIRLGKDFMVTANADSWVYQQGDVAYAGLPFPGLAGSHQLHNAAAAICAVNCLQTNLAVTTDDIRAAIANTRLAGRFEQHEDAPQVTLDVAHNPASAEALSSLLRETVDNTERWVAVFAMQQNREVGPFVEQLKDVICRWYVAPMQEEIGHSAAALSRAIINCQPDSQVEQCSSISIALRSAQRTLAAKQRIIVMGSFYTVSEARAALHV